MAHAHHAHTARIRPQRRTRAYYQFGSGGLVYLVALGMVLGLGIGTQSNLLFWAVGLIVGGGIVSLVLARQMMQGLDASRVLPAHGISGEEMVLRYRLENRKAWLPVFGLVIQEGWGKGVRGYKRTGPVSERPQRLRGQPHGWVLHLAPNTAVQAEAPCWPARRGPLKLEKIVLYTSFPFGIFRRVLEIWEPGEVLVYPHLYRINKRVLFRLADLDPVGKKRLEKAGGHEEFFGLRQYRAGDPPKMIDWKRSAKTGSLVTREMTQPSPPRIMVALDLSQLDPPKATHSYAHGDGDGNGDEPTPGDGGTQPDPQPAAQPIQDSPLAAAQRRAAELDPFSPVERAISLTASVVCDAYFNGYQVGLTFIGAKFPSFSIHHSLPHRNRMLEALSGFNPELRSGESEMPTENPTVIIRPGAGSEWVKGAGQTTLGTDEMDHYVIDIEGGSSQLLAKRAAQRSSQRAAVTGTDPWT